MTKSTLIEISEEDLNVSKLLYNNGQFPHSIFYLQQSIEKLVKHLGVSNDVISHNKLKKDISHKADKIFKELVYRTLEFTGETKESIDRDHKNIIEFNRNVPLKELLPTIKMTIDEYKCYTFPENFKESIKSLIDFIQNKEVDKDKIKIDEEILDRKIDEYKKILPPYHSSIMTLFIMSNFFSDYVSCVRYPSEDEFRNPSHIFKFDHELVLSLPYFFQCQYENIKNIFQFQSAMGMIEVKF